MRRMTVVESMACVKRSMVMERRVEMASFEGILRLESSMSLLHAIELLVDMIGVVKTAEVKASGLRCQGMV